MNNLRNIIVTILTFAALVANAQTDEATTTKIVEAKTYTFVARSASPLNAQDINQVMSKFPGANGGGSINLTGDYYEVKITPDSVVAFLPYYGRSYTAPTNPNEGGIKFTSKNFDYKIIKGKKRGWDASINTKDVNEGYRLNLNIGNEGYATLSLISNNKQSITYSGYLKENDKK